MFFEERLLERILPDLTFLFDGFGEDVEVSLDSLLDSDGGLPSGLWDPEAGSVVGGMNYSEEADGSDNPGTGPPSLRGELTRWLLELRAGVFVGTLKPVVRRKLWERVCSGLKGGAGILTYPARNEQGYEVEFWGATDRWIVDRDGLKLVQVPKVE